MTYGSLASSGMDPSLLTDTRFCRFNSTYWLMFVFKLSNNISVSPIISSSEIKLLSSGLASCCGARFTIPLFGRTTEPPPMGAPFVPPTSISLLKLKFEKFFLADNSIELYYTLTYASFVIIINLTEWIT